MEHNGKREGPAEENNSEIVINDPDTQLSTVKKRSNSPKDSKPGNGSDSICPFSGYVTQHSVNKNHDSSNTDCGKRNIDDCDVPTDITECDELANSKKIAALVRKVLHNEIPDEETEWPLCLLIESNRSVKISRQELQNMIYNKAAEVMALHGQSQIAKQMVNIAVCKEQQRSYYKKYKELSRYASNINNELDLLDRVPDNEAKHVRHVETNVNIFSKKKKKKLVYTGTTYIKKPPTNNL